MVNEKVKTILTRRAIQWEDFLQSLIDQINEDGYSGKIYKPELERLILRHISIPKIKEDIIKGFKGISKVKPEVRQWMKGS